MFLHIAINAHLYFSSDFGRRSKSAAVNVPEHLKSIATAGGINMGSSLNHLGHLAKDNEFTVRRNDGSFRRYYS